MTAADDPSPEVKTYIDGPQGRLRRRDRRCRPVGVHVRLLHGDGRALIKGLEESAATSPTSRALQTALAGVTLTGDEAPWGDVKLDDNRQAISDIFVKKIVADKTGDGVPDVQTLFRIPEVDQTFGGFFTADTPAPDRENPKCEKGTAAPVGRQRREGRLRRLAPDRWQFLRHPLKAPRRSSACGGSAGASAGSSPSPGWTSTSAPASGGRSSARTGPARPRSST